jgi:hypothetical protein
MGFIQGVKEYWQFLAALIHLNNQKYESGWTPDHGWDLQDLGSLSTDRITMRTLIATIYISGEKEALDVAIRVKRDKPASADMKFFSDSADPRHPDESDVWEIQLFGDGTSIADIVKFAKTTHWASVAGVAHVRIELETPCLEC